mmetsp:Transcript_30882/g.88830  ORF Transcript_30882/g.88830 Transcript_30882/m.88830 type:complete len:224 (+) Transcript_30882:146-817(+)
MLISKSPLLACHVCLRLLQGGIAASRIRAEQLNLGRPSGQIRQQSFEKLLHLHAVDAHQCRRALHARERCCHCCARGAPILAALRAEAHQHNVLDAPFRCQGHGLRGACGCGELGGLEVRLQSTSDLLVHQLADAAHVCQAVVADAQKKDQGLARPKVSASRRQLDLRTRPQRHEPCRTSVCTSAMSATLAGSRERSRQQTEANCDCRRAAWFRSDGRQKCHR